MSMPIKLNDVSKDWYSAAILNINNNDLKKEDNSLIIFEDKKIFFLFSFRKEISKYNIFNLKKYETICYKEYKYNIIKRGILEVSKLTTNKFLPNHTNFIRHIDFLKGCFRGQEIVLRIKNLSYDKKNLALFEMEKNISNNIEFYPLYLQLLPNKKKIVGHVISSIFFKEKTYILACANLNLKMDATYSAVGLSNIRLLKYFS